MPHELNHETMQPDFAEPIDLSNGGTYTIPYITRPALLQVADEWLLVTPELNPVVSGLQDYKVINLQKAADVHESLEAEGADPETLALIFHSVDSMMEREEGLPADIILIRHGEEAFIGRKRTPQLELGRLVSAGHVTISAGTDGLTFHDVNSTNGTALYLHREDAEANYPPLQESVNVASAERDLIYNELSQAFVPISENGRRVDYEDNALQVSGTFVGIQGTPFLCLELNIDKADKYPDLRPPEGYRMTIIKIDPLHEGITVVSWPDYERNETGISKTPLQLQASSDQAAQLRLLAKELQYRKND